MFLKMWRVVISKRNCCLWVKCISLGQPGLMYLLVWYVIWGLIKDGDRAGSIAFQEKKKGNVHSPLPVD